MSLASQAIGPRMALVPQEPSTDPRMRIIPVGSEEALAQEWAKLPEVRKRARMERGEKPLAPLSAFEAKYARVFLKALKKSPGGSAAMARVADIQAYRAAHVLGKMRRQGLVTASRAGRGSAYTFTITKKGRAFK